MATTKIWDIRDSLGRVVNYAENPDKTANPTYSEHELQGLYDVMNYATNERKTEMQYYVSGVNCMPETARRQMIMTKRQFGKEGGIVAFHAYQSFKPGEVTADQCHQMGVELAQELWGSRFEIVVATHLNTACLHNHFVLNSVSFLDGKRYNDCKRTYREFRNLSDQICREYGLSVIENPQKTKTPRSLYLAEQRGEPTLYNLMRADIDAVLGRAFTERQFYNELRQMGYLLRYDEKRKYATIQIPGTKHPTRFKTLGENYTQEAINKRILQNLMPSRPLPPPPKFKPYNLKINSFRGLYIHYCYLLGVIKKNPHPHYSAALRADVRKLEEYSEQARLLCCEQIDTAEQLQAFMDKTQEQIPVLIKERERVYKRISRCKDENRLPELARQRDTLTESIIKLRKDLKNVKAVMERSGVVAEKVKHMQEYKNTPRPEQYNLR